MGRIGVVLGFEQRTIAGVKFGEVKVDFGASDVATCLFYPQPGFDTWPIAGDFAFCSDAPGGGGYVVSGIVDPKLGSLPSAAGESVVYSRRGPGDIAAIMRLRADGSIDINDGAVTIAADGAVSIAASLSVAGDVAADGDVTAGTLSLTSHTHAAGLLVAPSGGGPVTGTTGGAQ